VLVGSWVNDRAQHTPDKLTKPQYTTSYKDNFGLKVVKHNPNIVWDQIMKTEDSNFISDVGNKDSPNFLENFSSLYDLSYNHFPKCYKSNIPRIYRFLKDYHEPLDDYLPSFGNVTKSGLVEQKREEWKYDQNNPRSTDPTSYRCQFQAPATTDYDFKRFVHPLTNWNALGQVNLLSFEMLPKQRKHQGDFGPSTLVAAHKEKYCNPITGECTPDLKNKPNQRR
jgi:hypothetical protein